MENKRVETIYVAKLDKASYGRVSKELKSQSADQVKSAKAQLGVQKDINAQQRKNAKELKRANDEQIKSVKLEKTRLELLEKQNTATRNRVGSVGDVDSSLSAIRGGASAITGTNIAGLEQVAGVFELTEAVVQLKGAAPAAKEAIGGLVSSIASPTGLALTAVAAVATVGVALLSKTIGQDFANSVRDLKAEIDATNTVIDDISTGKTYDQIFQDRAALLIELDATSDKLLDVNSKIGEVSADLGTNLQSTLSGQKQVLLDARTELSQTTADQIALLAEYDAALLDNRTATNDARTSVLDRTDSLREQFDIEQRVTNFANTATIESLEARKEALQLEKELILSQLAELKALPVENTTLGRQTQETIDKLESQFNALNTETKLLSGTLGDNVRARESEAQAVEAVKERTKELDAIQKQRESTLGRLNGLESQSIKILDDFARARTELTQERQLRDIRELEDFNNEVAQANREHQSDLASINKDGNDTIADINADIKDLQKDFYSDEIKATQDYRKDLKKLNREYQIEDKQALDDHLASLRNAEQNNDVIAFLQAQQSFKQEQKEKQSTRSEEFKDLNNQFNEERRLRRQDFNERRQELQREITLTRQQTQQKLQEAQQAFQQEQQLANQERQLKLQRQRQDDAIADQRAQQALQRQLAEINKKAQAEINAIRQVTSAIGQLQAVANRIAGSTSGGSSSSYRGGSSSGSTPLGQKSYEQNRVRGVASLVLGARGQRVASGQSGFAFADGGIVDRPTIGIVGEGRRPEAIIPFERSKGLPSALRDYGIMPKSGRGAGGAVVNLNFAPNLTVGDIATGNDVSKALQDFANDLTSQLDTGLKRAINQTA